MAVLGRGGVVIHVISQSAKAAPRADHQSDTMSPPDTMPIIHRFGVLCYTCFFGDIVTLEGCREGRLLPCDFMRCQQRFSYLIEACSVS